MLSRSSSVVRAFVLMLALGGPSVARAQDTQGATRSIAVDGMSMRVWTTGLEARRAGRPVVVLEAGAGAGLDTWTPVFGELAKMAPVVAYDRRGLGQSEPDRLRPTLPRQVENLYALLQALGVPGPLVLVGHSFGGVIIRGYAVSHPKDVAGLVYLDVPDFEATRQERAAVLPEADRPRALAPAALPPIPPDTPPGLRAVFEELGEETANDYPSARAWRQPEGVPTGVVVTARADRLRGNGGAMVRLHIKHQSEWTLGSPNSLFVVAGHTGHQVHRDDPRLVVDLIAHVLRQATRTP